MNRPQYERRVDLATRIDFDEWLYVRRGVHREEISREQLDELRTEYVHDGMWQTCREVVQKDSPS